MIQSNEALYSAIYSWIEKTPLSDFHEAISKRVIGQPILKDICSAVYSYLWCLLHDTIPNHNFILAAPSGSGKRKPTVPSVTTFSVPSHSFLYTQLTSRKLQQPDFEELNL